jgi:hypothetical protein
MAEALGQPQRGPGRRQRMPPWGLPAVLMLLGLGLAAQYGLRAREDAAVAPRQQVAAGTLTRITRGKHFTGYYSFAWAGAQYRGSDRVSSNQCLCDVPVYFDPSHPATNSRVEYHRKAWADHMTMIFCLCLAGAMALLLAVFLAMRKPRRQPQPDYSQAA